MSNHGWVSYGRGLVDDALAKQESWSDVVQDLQSEGLDEEVISTLLRERLAWFEEAREWKQHGYPYEEIVRYLRNEVAASWSDVAYALMEIGMTPADMLRVVLPNMEEGEITPVIHAALLGQPDDAGGDEAREVVDYFFPGASERIAGGSSGDFAGSKGI